jgi:hypothetical protein
MGECVVQAGARDAAGENDQREPEKATDLLAGLLLGLHRASVITLDEKQRQKQVLRRSAQDDK